MTAEQAWSAAAEAPHISYEDAAEVHDLGPAEWAFQTLLRIAQFGLHDSRRDELRALTKVARDRHRGQPAAGSPDTVTDAMVAAYRQAAEAECGNPLCACDTSLRAGLEAVVPLIRAQVADEQVPVAALRSVLADREHELLDLKGSCSNGACRLHYAHSGPCDTKGQR